VHPHDPVGYITAQVLGAIMACARLRLAWGSSARSEGRAPRWRPLLGIVPQIAAAPR